MEEKVFFSLCQTVNESDYVAYAKACKPLRKVNKLLYILSAVGALVIVFAIVFIKDKKVMITDVAILVPVIIAALIFASAYCSIAGRLMYKDAYKVRNGKMNSEIYFREYDVLIMDDQGERKIFYTQFEDVVESESRLFLMLTKTSGLIVKRDNFIVQEEEDLAEFIRKRMGK